MGAVDLAAAAAAAAAGEAAVGGVAAAKRLNFNITFTSFLLFSIIHFTL